MKFTRRDFGKLAMPAAASVALPRAAFSMGWAATQSSKINGVQIGVQTYSFRQGIEKNMIPSVMQKIGLFEAELMSGDAEAIAGAPTMSRPAGPPPVRNTVANAEPAPNGCPANSPSGRDSLEKAGKLPARASHPVTPEQEAYAKSLADWRKSTSVSTWKGVRQKFNDAGVNVQFLCYNMSESITDDEIEYAFQMARDLGAQAITSSSTVIVAKRVAPFADKHKMVWAGHGHADVFDDNQFAKPETFLKIMSFSKYIGVNLDIGHFVGGGFDPLDFIPKVHDRIASLHLKDCTKPDKCYNSGNLPWGTGQTPIKEVLKLMEKNKYTFPANIEYEYRTPEGSDTITEVTKCYDFIKKSLA